MVGCYRMSGGMAGCGRVLQGLSCVSVTVSIVFSEVIYSFW